MRASATLLCLLLAGVCARAQDLPAAQRERIDATIAQFPPRDGTGPRAFFLGFAGFGGQRVFAEEIKLAARTIGEKYGSTPRTLLLINDRRDLEKYPLASQPALSHAVEGLAKTMNRDQDVLFLVLASHGTRDAMIEVSNTDMPPRGLDAKGLAELLEKSGIRWKVIVVSACFSGAFIRPLADDHTIVLTAAAKNRTSFGCSDDRDLTYFGEALYRDALPGAPSLRAAFEAARTEIRRREKEEHVRASRPQAHFGELLESRLDQMPGARNGAGEGFPGLARKQGEALRARGVDPENPSAAPLLLLPPEKGARAGP